LPIFNFMSSLLLLHGAIGAADQLQPLVRVLEANHKVHTLNFSGHGGALFPVEPFSIELFAREVLAYMDKEGLQRASVFGYSMGGYVAMYLAKHHANRIDKVITLATKFHWTEEIAAKETGMLNPDKIAAKLPDFATVLEKRHAPNDWHKVLNKTSDMLRSLGESNTLKPDEYASIETPCLILLGDRDKMVSLEETVDVFKSLPNAQMGILPGTPHPIEQVDVELLSFFISRFG
jgi:pimeloyl-ACP methyl ester carboxylesterase